MSAPDTYYPSGYASKKSIENWLSALMDKYALVAPQETAGITLYQALNDVHQIAWDNPRPKMSIKEFFFPPTEQLMLIGYKGDQVSITETIYRQNQIIIGVRPCDARSLRALDAVFISTAPVDAYYARRRVATALIGLACEKMGDTCFCTSVGGAPDDPRDLDILLTKADDGFSVQIVSEKGRALAAELELSPMPQSLARPHSVQGASYPIPKLDAWPPLFNNAYWEEMAERCLSCRACAYVCPTCRCFDVRDEALPGEDGRQRFERIRCWDSCAGENYRRTAGGHKPRATKGERLRNRYFCKFYYFPQQYGPIACTGCGRCIDVCPVNIDITETLQHLAEVC